MRPVAISRPSIHAIRASTVNGRIRKIGPSVLRRREEREPLGRDGHVAEVTCRGHHRGARPGHASPSSARSPLPPPRRRPRLGSIPSRRCRSGGRGPPTSPAPRPTSAEAWKRRGSHVAARHSSTAPTMPVYGETARRRRGGRLPIMPPPLRATARTGARRSASEQAGHRGTRRTVCVPRASCGRVSSTCRTPGSRVSRPPSQQRARCATSPTAAASRPAVARCGCRLALDEAPDRRHSRRGRQA